MTRTEALDLHPRCHYARTYWLQTAYGTDGEHWYAAYRNEEGTEWAERLVYPAGSTAGYGTACGLEVAGVDWLPGDLLLDGPPRPD